MFYETFKKGKKVGQIYGFPMQRGAWCNDRLKVSALDSIKSVYANQAPDANVNIIQYIGIAADEPERILRHTKPGISMPLVDAGWDEAYCRQWCEERDLLSPIYTTATRGGCWFCHNQGVSQLRLLRKNHPDLWELLMKWDLDSPVTFHADGRTVHDFDKRFHYEEEGLVPSDRRFKWKMLEQLNSENCSE